MTPAAPTRSRNIRRELSQLLGLTEHALGELSMLRRELASPMTQNVLESVRRSGEEGVPGQIGTSAQALDRSIEALEGAMRAIRSQMATPLAQVEAEGIPSLPPRLARFLAERHDIDGFHYEVKQDRIRGWVVLWKEYGPDGVLRGAGQFYERPYAWLDE